MAVVKFRCGGHRIGWCDYEAPVRWTGRCPGCFRYYNCERVGPAEGQKGPMTAATLGARPPARRFSTGVPEFDTILGGGLVVGSTVVLIGEPGGGKSTLLMQAAHNVSSWGRKKGEKEPEDPRAEALAAQGEDGEEKRPRGRRVLYTSGEQSAEDIGIFVERVGAGANDRIVVMGNEGDIYKIVAEAEELEPTLLIVDSVNTAFLDDIEADVASARQISAVANYLTSFGKSEKVTNLIVCQINKEGDMAGPKNLEHLVDAVVYLDKFHPDDTDSEFVAQLTKDELDALRVITAGKNRFAAGAAYPEALLELTPAGLFTPKKKKTRLLLV